MEFPQNNSCSVIQYHKGSDMKGSKSKVINQNSVKKSESNNSVEQNDKEVFAHSNGIMIREPTSKQKPNHDSQKVENSMDSDVKDIKQEDEQCRRESVKEEKSYNGNPRFPKVIKVMLDASEIENLLKKESIKLKSEPDVKNHSDVESEEEPPKRGRKRKLSETPTDGGSSNATNPKTEDVKANDEFHESDFEDGEEMENKPRRRGRCKKNPDIIPSHLSSDVVLGYKILLKFLETPQFSGFLKPSKKSTTESVDKITCLNQIKKKFDNNDYKNVCEFVNDVREMLVYIYESRNPVATKRALRLEQILEQRIAQLPNYLRPQCALVLPPDEVSSSLNKIRISKGGGFVSLLLEKTERERSEKNREKRKLLAEERKQLKEEQDKDVQDWEKNVLLKDVEEEMKSMWELPAVGQFIYLCSDLLNIGVVSQYEVERMLLMPQCSDTLDLVMTALLNNSLVRAKLDHTPPMPYSIWAPLVRSRVGSWYRFWQRENKNEQKVFEEIGIEPDFWEVLGPDKNPLEFNAFHEVCLLQRVWILKALCDVDFAKKKTVQDNIRGQPFEELSPVCLGVDRDGNRYVQFTQFSKTDIRIYRQSVMQEDKITPSELVESQEGFERRTGAVTAEKEFKDIWDLGEKPEVKYKKKKGRKQNKDKSFSKVHTKVNPPAMKKNLRKSVRAKQKTYVDWSESDLSDSDLCTVKNKTRGSDPDSLYRPAEREFISLSVFRLPREKLSSKPTGKRSTASKRGEDSSKSEGATGDKATKYGTEGRKEDGKPGCEDEQFDCFEAKPNQETQSDFDKSYQGDDDDDLEEKEEKFSAKMMPNKGDSGEEAFVEAEVNNAGEDTKGGKDSKKKVAYEYNIPNRLKPDSNKFYLVVDSVEGLRQFISKFGSHENDLEIITRSTKTRRRRRRRRRAPKPKRKTSCEVKLIETLQKLLVEIEPLELDLMKSFRLNREKMYKEYVNYLNRPIDFVHPNETYWMKTCEEPAPSTGPTTNTTTTVTTTDGSGGNMDKSGGKENGTSAGESTEKSQSESLLDVLGPRKRTRVARLQLQPENDELSDDSEGVDDCESNGSDDIWVFPTPKKRTKREGTLRSLRFPRRCSGRRRKSSPSEKMESQSNTTPEKSKKPLFWGQRGSDPSEDLNWETNRQKILEKHNSPIKKLLVEKPEESNRDTTSPKNAFQKQSEIPATSVIKAPPKKYITQISGNKKPHSSTQVKTLDNQAKQRKLDEHQRELVGVTSPKQEVKTIVSGTGSKTTTPDKVQTHNKTNKISPKQTTAKVQPPVRPKPPTPKPTTSRSESTILHQTLTQPSQIKVQNLGQLTTVVQSVDNFSIEGGVIQPNPINQAQLLQPLGRIQQIQVQQPSGQTRTMTGTMANVGMQQPIQWQSKMFTLQTIDHTGSVIQQQHQVQNQGQAQLQSQGQLQQMFQIEPGNTDSGQSTIQIPGEKLVSIQQMIQKKGTASETRSEKKLFVTNGKMLLKFDTEFVDDSFINENVVEMNDKMDMKKPLIIVKPKSQDENADGTTSQSQPVPSTNQQNILLINKPTYVQQSLPTSTVSSFVIHGNYTIKGVSETQARRTEAQTVKIVQPASTYVIQQKPIINRDSQSQIIKIITSQPLGSNQNIMLGSANLNLANQVLCNMNQTVVTRDQQTKPLAIRLMRSVAVSSPGIVVQSKANLGQNPIILNNTLQIQGQRVEGPRAQGAIVSGRIVNTEVPNVRMATPAIVPSSSPQTLRLVRNQSAQPLRIATPVQPRLSSTQVAGTQPAGIATVLTAQPLRIATSLHPQTIVSSSNLNPQAIASMDLVQAIPSNSQHLLSVVSSPSLHPDSAGPKTILTSQPVPPALLSVQPISSASAFISTSEELDTTKFNQSFRHITNPQPETVFTSSSQSIRVVTIAQPQLIYTSAIASTGNAIGYFQGARGPISTIVQAARPTMSTIVQPTRSTIVQPIRLASGGKPQTIKIIPNNNPGIRFVNINTACTKATVIANSASTPLLTTSGNSQLPEVVTQPVRVQTIVKPSEFSQDGEPHSG